MASSIQDAIRSLDYTKEQKDGILDVVELTEKLVEKHIPPQTARKWEEEGVGLRAGRARLPEGMPELYGRIQRELGLTGLIIPEDYGGVGLPYAAVAAAVEIIARRDPGVAVQLAVHTSAIDAILMFGTEEQKRVYLPLLATGERLGAMVFTEPQAGSDVGAGTTSAVLKGDRYAVNGSKTFITGAGLANLYVLSAVTDPKNPSKARRLSTFLFDVDEHGAGCRVSRLEEKMVLKTSPTGQIDFEDASIPRDALLGQPGKGTSNLLTILNDGRIQIAAQAIGIAQGAYELAASYSLQRRQFEKSIISFQGVGFKLAEMSTRIAAARQLAYYAAWLKDHAESCLNNPALVEACSQAKLYASQTASWVCGEALEVFGGYGVCTEFHVERYYRNAKITEIYEGTSNIQKLTLGRLIESRFKTG